jgi:hypothetical protein
VSQHQSSTGSAWPAGVPNLMSSDFGAMCTKGAENFGAIQKEWLETVQRAHRDWVSRLEADAKLGSEFASKVAAAKALPEAAAAYQEWMGRRMELFSKDWQKVVEDTQKFLNTCTRIAANGKGAGVT